MDHEAGSHTELLRIGVFSTLSRISVRMLRHYHECGLLSPAVVDPFTGHRFYRASQLSDAALVVELRDAGFRVEAIAELIRVSGEPSKVKDAIEAQRRNLRAELGLVYSRLSALDRFNTSTKENLHMTTVSTSIMPEMTVGSLRKTIPSYSDEGVLWEEIMPLLVQSGAAFPAGGIAGATFHDNEFREADVDVEAWIQVSGPFEAVLPLKCRNMPAQEYVVSTMRGDYSQTSGVLAAIGAYIAENNLQTGPMFNIYRVGPTQNPDPASWITDVCVPVVRK